MEGSFLAQGPFLRDHSSAYVHPPIHPLNFTTRWLISMNIGMDIMLFEANLTFYVSILCNQ
jgi:hypothetical protein